MSTAKSWDQAIHPLDTQELASNRRLGWGCTARGGHARKCAETVLYACSYSYVTGARGKIATRRVARCEDHAKAFAEKHDLELPAHNADEIGPIVEVHFPHLDGRPGGGMGYTLGVEHFSSNVARPGEQNQNLLRDREPLEIWLWSLGVWRTCYFRWNGMDPPELVIDVHDKGSDLVCGQTVKVLDPRDTFREPEFFDPPTSISVGDRVLPRDSDDPVAGTVMDRDPGTGQLGIRWDDHAARGWREDQLEVYTARGAEIILVRVPPGSRPTKGVVQ